MEILDVLKDWELCKKWADDYDMSLELCKDHILIVQGNVLRKLQFHEVTSFLEGFSEGVSYELDRLAQKGEE